MPVNFDQHLHAERVRLCGQLGDERERLRNHEAAGACLLDRESDCIEPDRSDAGVVQARREARRGTGALRDAVTSMSI